MKSASRFSTALRPKLVTNYVTSQNRLGSLDSVLKRPAPAPIHSLAIDKLHDAYHPAFNGGTSLASRLSTVLTYKPRSTGRTLTNLLGFGRGVSANPIPSAATEGKAGLPSGRGTPDNPIMLPEESVSGGRLNLWMLAAAAVVALILIVRR